LTPNTGLKRRIYAIINGKYRLLIEPKLDIPIAVETGRVILSAVVSEQLGINPNDRLKRENSEKDRSGNGFCPPNRPRPGGLKGRAREDFLPLLNRLSEHDERQNHNSLVSGLVMVSRR